MRLSSLILVLWVTPALADWPMARGNSRRTGEISDPASLQTPVVSWRRYLGGELGADQMVARDVDGDGAPEVVLIVGGKLVAKRPDDIVVWETPPMGITAIRHVADLDGDGRPEFVVSGEGAFLGIIDLRTGALRWRMASGTFGTVVGAVRLADFDADGVDDLYAADNACGSVNGTSRAMAWHFRSGFGPVIDDGSRRLWELPANREYVCGNADVVADLDADGVPEIIAFGIRRAYVYDGQTGVALPSGQTDPGYDLGFSIPYGVMRVELADVDGSGKKAMVAVTNNTYDPSINSRALWVMRFDRSVPADRVHVLWRHSVPNLVTDVHAYGPAFTGDLDGDGRSEVFSTFVEGGTRTFTVFDGLTGAVKTSRTNVSFLAMVSLAPQEVPTLLISEAGAIQGHRFEQFDGGFPTPKFTLPGASPVPVVSYQPRRAVNMGTNWATMTVTGSTRRAVVLDRGGRLETWSTDSTPALLNSLDLPSDVQLRGVAPHQGLAGRSEGLLLARSDGYLVAVDTALTPLNLSEGELGLPGIRTGGYYSGARSAGHPAIAARLGPGHDELLVRDSRGRMLRLDPTGASLVVPPAIRWSVTGAMWPMALDVDRDGTRDLLVSIEDSSVVGRDVDAGVLFRVNHDPDWSVPGYAAPLQLADGGWRFAVPQQNSGNGEGRLISVTAAGPDWNGVAEVTAGSGQGFVTVDDFDGDGNEDGIMNLRGLLQVHRGTDGVKLGSGAPSHSLLPVTVRGRAGAITTIGAACYHQMEGLSVTRPPASTTAPTWSVTLPQRFYATFAATSLCSSELRLVHAGYLSSHLLVLSAATGVERAHVVLAQGRQFASEGDALDAGMVLGSLGNATALDQLWPGQPGVLLGSTDGYLYAVDPCAAGAPLLWAMNFRAPVGEAIPGDLDGDGQQELVVSAGDGFLYGIGQQKFPAPMEALDVEAGGSVDIDESHVVDSLSVSWSAVTGATGYEWALFTSGGTAVSRHPTVVGNPFVPVGAGVTSATYQGALHDGARYVFAVRAVGAPGSSSETLSDGVRYVPMASPDAGTPDAGQTATTDAGMTADAGRDPGSIRGGTGCGCGATSWATMLWLIVPVLATRRRGRSER